MYRDKILLKRKVTPQRVKLPDGRSFLEKYERVSRKNLPSNVTIRRNRAIGPRQQRNRKTQQGAGLLGSVFNLGKNLLSSGALAKGLSMGLKTINSGTEEKGIDEGIKHASELYKLGTKKIENKSLKMALESDIANYADKQAQETYLTGKMSKGITNFQIQNAFKN